MDHSGLMTDIAGLQTAVSDLSNAANRAAAAALLATTVAPATAGKRIVKVPKPSNVNSTDHYRTRALAAGA